MSTKTLQEIIHGMLYEFYKQAKGQPSIRDIEKMDTSSRTMAADLDKFIQASIRTYLREFQGKVVEAFKAVENEINKLNDRTMQLLKLEEEIKKIPGMEENLNAVSSKVRNMEFYKEPQSQITPDPPQEDKEKPSLRYQYTNRDEL